MAPFRKPRFKGGPSVTRKNSRIKATKIGRMLDQADQLLRHFDPDQVDAIEARVRGAERMARKKPK